MQIVEDMKDLKKHLRSEDQKDLNKCIKRTEIQYQNYKHQYNNETFIIKEEAKKIDNAWNTFLENNSENLDEIENINKMIRKAMHTLFHISEMTFDKQRALSKETDRCVNKILQAVKTHDVKEVESYMEKLSSAAERARSEAEQLSQKVSRREVRLNELLNSFSKNVSFSFSKKNYT